MHHEEGKFEVECDGEGEYWEAAEARTGARCRRRVSQSKGLVTFGTRMLIMQNFRIGTPRGT